MRNISPTKSKLSCPLISLSHILNSFFQDMMSSCWYMSNTSLSGPQNGLLLWYWKLGISMYKILEFIQPIEAHEPFCFCFKIPFVIILIFKSIPKIKNLLFVSHVNFFFQIPCVQSQAISYGPSRSRRRTVLKCLQSQNFSLSWPIWS